MRQNRKVVECALHIVQSSFLDFNNVVMTWSSVYFLSYFLSVKWFYVLFFVVKNLQIVYGLAVEYLTWNFTALHFPNIAFLNFI